MVEPVDLHDLPPLAFKLYPHAGLNVRAVPDRKVDHILQIAGRGLKELTVSGVTGPVPSTTSACTDLSPGL